MPTPDPALSLLPTGDTSLPPSGDTSLPPSGDTSLPSTGSAALDALLPVVYDELRRLAHRCLAHERPDHTLNTTALVHEAYLRLADYGALRIESRAQFFGLAARVMRHILVNYAAQRRTQKRGGGQPVLALDATGLHLADASSEAVLVLDEALHHLQALSPRQAQVVECRFFGGLSVEETAEALACSTATVKREWRLARAWLNHRLAS